MGGKGEYFKTVAKCSLGCPVLAVSSRCLLSCLNLHSDLSIYAFHYNRDAIETLQETKVVFGFRQAQQYLFHFIITAFLSTPSFGEEVKPSVPFRRFAACKRSLNGVEVVISAKLPYIIAHSSHFRRWDLSRRSGRGGTWW